MQKKKKSRMKVTPTCSHLERPNSSIPNDAVHSLMLFFCLFFMVINFETHGQKISKTHVKPNM